jgi:flotillin
MSVTIALAATLSVAIIAAVAILTMMAWRKVVPQNEVHVVNSSKKSIAFGGTQVKNVYYSIPSFIPVFGVVVSRMPTSIFSLKLEAYDSYDSDKVPFEVDVQAFFNIEDAVKAASKIRDFSVLQQQLDQVLKGGVRKALAGKSIEMIMSSRSDLSKEFVDEVQSQVVNWGVKVLNIEFFDIRDSKGSQVITQIMAKEMSRISMESRQKVAENERAAKVKEIDAQQEVANRNAEMIELTGVRTEQAKQKVAEMANVTKSKELEVVKTEALRHQEIENEKAISAATAANTKATLEKTATVTKAEAEKESQVIAASAEAEATKVKGSREAEVIELKGKASAEALKASKLAEAEGTLKQAEALTALNEAGLAVKKLEIDAEVQKKRWESMGSALAASDMKLVMGPEGMKLFGVELDAKNGASIGQFSEQAGLASLAERLLGKKSSKE